MIYFDPTTPLLLSTEESFDGHAVEVNETTAQIIIQIAEALVVMRERIFEAGAPEDYAQELAERFVNDVAAIIEGDDNGSQSYNF